jgi:transposase
VSEIEIIADGAGGRHRSAEEKLRIVEETLSAESVSVVARRHGVRPNLLYRCVA